MMCEHETPGGPQACPLCRHQIRERHRREQGLPAEPMPVWKQTMPTRPVPMPDHVRAMVARLREPRQVQDGLL